MKRLFQIMFCASLLTVMGMSLTGCDDFPKWHDNFLSPQLNVEEASMTVRVGQTQRCNVSSIMIAKLLYTSSDEKIASVDEHGLVTGVSEGEAVITVVATNMEDGKLIKEESAFIDVKVLSNIRKYDSDDVRLSFHADHAWTWYEPSQRYDLEGEKAGVYYDGNLTKEDGKGKWWEGLDPQMLYQQRHPMSKGSWNNSAIHSQWDWSHGACPPSKEFVTNFYDRTLDAINRYNPDLIYFDVTVLPFYPISDCGLKIAAHMYNKNPRGVVFGKILSDEQRQALTWDVERGAPNEIIPEPWQTCNCIGGWHYNTSIYEKGRYKSAATVVKQLVDIVSKNGNLLLSIPLRADGTYDEKEAVILDDLEAWMTVNGESIFGTRPWVKFGEGPVAEKDIKINAQGFNDGQFANMDAHDIRFNQTKKHLYVTAMGWPADGRLIIKSLAKGNKDFKRAISSVTLLGYGKLKVHQTAEGLEVSLPQPCNNIAPVLKIAK